MDITLVFYLGWGLCNNVQVAYREVAFSGTGTLGVDHSLNRWVSDSRPSLENLSIGWQGLSD